MSSDEPAMSPTSRRRWDRRQITGAAISGVVIAAIATLLIVGLVNRDVNNSIDASIAKGERVPAPAFTLPVLTSTAGLPPAGQNLSLAELHGHPVVLNIWASWCVPCTDEAPILQSIWNRYRAQGVYVLGVDVKDLTGDALGFHKEYGLTFPTVRDGEGNIEGPYGTTGVPESFIIDRNGKIAAALRGPLTASGASANVNRFVSLLDSIVAERS